MYKHIGEPPRAQGEKMNTVKGTMVGKRVCLIFGNLPRDNLVRRRLADLTKMKKASISKVIIQILQEKFEQINFEQEEKTK